MSGDDDRRKLEEAQRRLHEKREQLPKKEPADNMTPKAEAEKIVDRLEVKDEPEEKTCQACGEPMESSWNGLDYQWECQNQQCKSRLPSDPEPLLKSYGVPRGYRSFSLDNFEGGDRVKSFCSTYAEALALGGSGNAFFYGECGSGKTHLATATMREAILQGYNRKAHFISTSRLLMHIRDTFDDERLKERDLVDRFVRYDFLILDDIGAENVSRWSIATLYLIIDGRIAESKPTLATSNLSISKIERALGDRIASRLSGFTCIKFNQPDRRKLRAS